MGAGQIGGIATLLEIDFNNAAGFLGTKAEVTEAQYVVYYFSHALIFCMGTVIEPHVVLTPAICVFGERYKFEVHAGTHSFLENAGISRLVQHVCIHRGYNHTMRWKECASANLALLVLKNQLSFHQREPPADFVVNRVRYGVTQHNTPKQVDFVQCNYFGWGSRRNGYLIPLLITLHRMDVLLLPTEYCAQMWNHDSNFLCVQQRPCKDDLGSVIECSGFAVGMMVSRLVDRPCGVGFIDLSKFNKFLTCGVDDAREVIDHDTFMSVDLTTYQTAPTRSVITVPVEEELT